MKKIVASCALALVFIAPLSAAALTREEILAEIARLTKVVDVIKAQLRAIGVDVDNLDGGTPSGGTAAKCISWRRVLSSGMQGNDVLEVQNFLVRQGVLDSEPTGFYGTLTRGAVYRWQVAAGLEGTATVGPATADTMNAYCATGRKVSLGGTQPVNNPTTTTTTNPRLPVAPVDRFSFSVEPRSGAAPHQVSAFFAISGTTCTAYALDWGDGTTGVSREGNNATCDPDSINRQLTHVYAARGTYTVTFKTIRGFLSSAPVVSQATITVQ
ncbi:MAG: putative peptidoglycan binding domain [Candidatus Parcubacteria bacterium]